MLLLPSNAGLPGKGALDHAVRAFQSLLPLKYTSLSRYWVFFSKRLILASAVHSALLHIDMALLTCEAELPLGQGKEVLSSPDLISPKLTCPPPAAPTLVGLWHWETSAKSEAGTNLHQPGWQDLFRASYCDAAASPQC